jgi:uncharacterized membrane protein (UPF0182 family)
VDGPTQVFARINADPRFASERTLLSRSGSTVTFGDFLVMPLGDGVLYVQPVYVQASQNALPELTRVLVVNGSEIGIGETLTEALSQAVGAAEEPPDDGEQPPDDGEEPPVDGEEPPVGTIDEQIDALLREAAEHFLAADEALRAGDLATYQAEVEAAQAAVAEAERLLGAETAGATGATGVTAATGATG